LISHVINMKKTYLSILLFNLLALPVYAQTGTFSGTITDSKTGEALIGATVKIDGTELGSVTDINGFYTIKNIPTNTYSVTATYIGYNSLTKYNVVVRSEGNIDLNFKLDESVSELAEVVVTANPFEKLEETPMSIQKLSQEEVATYPGGNNDIAKVVQSLPGVAGSVGGFRNDVIIRGGAPNENVYYLDGVEIPIINHFSTQGSAGGPVGLLNVSFFEGVSLTSSSFGAKYDNPLSGVLQFNQRNGNSRHFQGNVRVSASEAALTTEGPLFKGKKEQSNTTFIASVRQSYLQFLFKAIGLPFLPNYWDYQYKVNHKINKYNEISVTGVGSIDRFAINAIKNFDPEQQAIQDQVPVIRQRTNAGGITWKNRFRDKSGYMQATLSTNMLQNTFLRYKDNVNENGLYFKNDSRQSETKLRYGITKFMGTWTTTYGFNIQNSNYTNITNDVVNNYTYDTKLNFFKYGLYAQTSAKFKEDQLSVSFGIRADGNSYMTTGNQLYRTLSPRGAISYRLKPKSKWTVNFSLGRYFKIPPYTILGFKNNMGQPINKSTRYIRNDHITAGLEYLINKSSRITIEGFLKLYDHYPVSINDSVSLANKGGGFEVVGNEPVSSVGKGKTYGMEFLYQQKFNGKYFAIVSYTVYRSLFTGFNTKNYKPSLWDYRNLISLTGGYKFNKNWEISSRYRYLGKGPYVPINQQATLANYPAVILDYSQLGNVRLKPYSQLDVRVTRKWNFRHFSLDVYIDVQNVLAHISPSPPQFGLKRDDSGNVITPQSLVRVDTNQSATVLPSLGLVLNF